MRILAVDDDQSIRELLPLILADAGITDVTVAGSSQEALSVIFEQDEPFDCFLLDIQMPGENGIQLCSAIRKLPDYQRAPIIMLTAMHAKSFIDEAFAAGATDYATKPFDVSELCARVRVAKFLSDEQRRVRKLTRVFAKPDQTDAKAPETGFADPRTIHGIKGLIPRQALSNYVSEVSRMGVKGCVFFALHIENGRNVFDKGSPAVFDNALRQIADAAMASPRLESVIMSYVGAGTFVCCSSAANLDAAERLEAEIQHALDDMDLTFDDGAPLEIEVAVGAPVAPSARRGLRLEDLEDLALEAALARVKEKHAARGVEFLGRKMF
jgi:CheY-like chemotaxis protein